MKKVGSVSPHQASLSINQSTFNRACFCGSGIAVFPLRLNSTGWLSVNIILASNTIMRYIILYIIIFNKRRFFSDNLTVR